EVRRQLDLVASVGLHTPDERLRFRYTPGDARRLRERLQAAGVAPGQPYLVVHPGASAPSRRWPPDRYGRAADAIARARGCAVVYTGSAHERATIDLALAVMHAPAAC